MFNAVLTAVTAATTRANNVINRVNGARELRRTTADDLANARAVRTLYESGHVGYAEVDALLQKIVTAGREHAADAAATRLRHAAGRSW